MTNIQTDTPVTYRVEPVTQQDMDAVLELFNRVFHKYMANVVDYVRNEADWKESVLVRIDGKPVGCYALKVADIYPFPGELEPMTKYKSGWRIGKGIEGVALAVDPSYRGLGIGKLLRAYPEACGRFAYSWGCAFKTLNNLSEWTSYRRLVADTGNMYITLRDHQPLALASHHSFQSSGYDCGPACVKMIASFTYGQLRTDYKELNSISSCNPSTGTNGSGIESALEAEGIAFFRNPFRSGIEPFLLMDNCLTGGSPLILRTLTNGAKHWTIVYGKTVTGNYLLADPWLGLHELSKSELDHRWAPREYDGFVII